MSKDRFAIVKDIKCVKFIYLNFFCDRKDK